MYLVISWLQKRSRNVEGLLGPGRVVAADVEPIDEQSSVEPVEALGGTTGVDSMKLFRPKFTDKTNLVKFTFVTVASHVFKMP
jgi:hypothetical protein